MSTLTIIRQRRHRRQASLRSGQQRSQRFVLALGFIVSAAVLISLVAAALVYADLTRSLPPVEGLPILLNPQDGLLLQPTRFYDRSGQHLLAALAPSSQARTFVPFDQIPKPLVDATVALADPGFWQHAGYTVADWQDPQAHPTLAQKLVFDLLLWDEPASIGRAVRERLLAGQATARYGRRQVMEWYLNSADYGHYAYGIQAAAQLYFNKPATRLDLGEAALLAAVSQAPALNPIDAPQAAEIMRLETLQIMQTMGLVTADQAAAARAEVPSLSLPNPVPRGEGNIAPAFVNLALDQLGKRFDRARIARGGLDIVTTLDYDLQLQSICTSATLLLRFEGITAENAAMDGSPCKAARLLPALQPGETLQDASASALILDPQAGQILAAVGDIHKGTMSASLASHPAGTLVTPFIYLTGFARGLNPASLGWDIPGSLSAIGQVYHGPVRLRIALANDYLPPAAHVVDQMGADSVRAIAASFGLEFPPAAHLLQDDFSIPPVEVAAAYGILADQGTLVGQPLTDAALHPVAVLKVTGADHSVWLDWSTPQARAVVSPQLAYLVNQVLSDETARWPSLGQSNPLEIGRPAGAKLARSLDLSGAWTAGYTPQRVTVVWLGASKATVTARLSANLWHALMQYAVRDLPSAGWDMPAGITTLEVCDPSGLLPTPACPNVVSEVFLAGREPLQADTLYQTFQVNRETGLLATVFTPPDLVEARVYMVVPPEARQWAQAAGIPTPPTEYDTIQLPPPLPGAHITSPSMFANTHGVVEVRGSATGEYFAYYRLEYGQGLDPSSWVQIGADSPAAVVEGRLASWDTGSLNGLYALRLLVVHSDQRVEQAVVQVTVDNTPPQVVVTYPQDGQAISAAGEPQVALQAQVSDPFLDKVDFYVDGILVADFAAGPFGFLWSAAPGEHTLRVVATDRAGNTSAASVKFTVNK